MNKTDEIFTRSARIALGYDDRRRTTRLTIIVARTPLPSQITHRVMGEPDAVSAQNTNTLARRAAICIRYVFEEFLPSRLTTRPSSTLP